MVKLIHSLFFNLGLYVGLSSERIHYSMYNYFVGLRYLKPVYNPMISLIAIKKMAIFLLLATKLNKQIIPIITSQNIKLYANQLSVDAHMNLNGNLSSNIYMSRSLKDSKVDVYRSFALRFFRSYNVPILLNKTGLIGWWLIYYKALKTKLYGYHGDYLKFNSQNFFNYAGEQRLYNNKIKRFFLVTKKRHISSQTFFLVALLYFKLYGSAFANFSLFKFKMGKYIRKFNKFFAFLKLLLFLRQYTIFPSILYYLNPTNAELRDSARFRVCTIAILNSYNSAFLPLYPVPANSSNVLSKVFYSYLFIYYTFIGKILMTLSVI